MEAHLALLALHVGIEAPVASKQPNHGLVQQVLSCMSWWKLVFVVFIENNFVCHLSVFFLICHKVTKTF
jgi:hypothetical protein